MREDGGAVLGEGRVAARVVAMEMRVDQIFDRLAARHFVDGRFDFVLQRRELAIHLDDAVIADCSHDVAALAFQHIGVVAERRDLHLDLRKIRLSLRIGRCRKQADRGCERETVSKLHWNVLLETSESMALCVRGPEWRGLAGRTIAYFGPVVDTPTGFTCRCTTGFNLCEASALKD